MSFGSLTPHRPAARAGPPARRIVPHSSTILQTGEAASEAPALSITT
ncbi:MAG: hypothetical protein AB1555_06665 [Nitrospirota bacterium]